MVHFDTKITAQDIPTTAEGLEELEADQLCVILNRDVMLRESVENRLRAIGNHIRMVQTNVQAERQANPGGVNVYGNAIISIDERKAALLEELDRELERRGIPDQSRAIGRNGSGGEPTPETG